MITPHDHQLVSIAEIRDYFRKQVCSVLWYLPTGGGKSFAAAFMILEAMQKGFTCWFVVHRRELIRQVERQFREMGIDYGVIAAGRDSAPWKLVQICSMGTLVRRLDTIQRRPHLMILDEAHHSGATTWADVLQRVGAKYIVGLSASPCRFDGRGLGEYFGALVRGPSPRELIARGYLSPFRTFAPPTVDTSKLHKRAGEFIASESEALMDRASVTGSAVGEYRKRCDGKRAIAFCTSIKHSQHVAQEFRDAGYRAVHMDGNTGDEIRDMMIADFERGAIQVLCNVDLCGEGLSVNAIECVILLRPTASLACFIQQAGRGLRTYPGKKELILLDHVGSTLQFGMLDEPREWTLTMDEIRAKKKPALSVRVCPKCWAASSGRSRVCTNCGHEFPVESREVDHRDGELVELTPEQIAKRAERMQRGRAKSLQELEEFGRMKGYASGWAAHLWQARQRKGQRA